MSCWQGQGAELGEAEEQGWWGAGTGEAGERGQRGAVGSSRAGQGWGAGPAGQHRRMAPGSGATGVLETVVRAGGERGWCASG